MSEAKTAPQYITGVCAGIGAFAVGTFIGWASPCGTYVQKGDWGFAVSENEWSNIAALPMLGAAFTCIPTGILINVLGRKLTMMLIVIPFVIGWLLIVFAQMPIMMMIGRFMTGMAGGGFCVCLPNYTTEIAQIHLRGALGSFFQMFLVVGVTFCFAVGPLAGPLILTYTCTAIPLVFLVLIIFMPESPAYLVAKGNMEAATKAYAFLRGKDYDPKAEIAAIQQDEAAKQQQSASVGSMLARKVTLKALLISIMLMFLQQTSGINAVMFFGEKIFSMANTGMKASTIVFFIGFLQIIFTLLAVLFVDKAGRKILLLISGGLMGVATAGLGFFFMKLDPITDPENIDTSAVEGITFLPVACVALYIIMFSIGFGPVPWLLIAELFASDIKSVAGAISGTTNWLLAYCVGAAFNPMGTHLGFGVTFFVYTACSFFGVVFMIFFVPETKGKTLPEIQAILGGEEEKPEEPTGKKK